jgi:DNA polymerase III subunit alpha
MDFLGLSTMSMLWDSIKHVGMSIEDLYALPVTDEKVFEAFRDNDVVGIFQFDGRAMRQVCARLKPDNFAEICDCNALARPGPLHNGAATAYADIKHGGRIPERLHPSIDAIIAPTQYQIVYQEQILRIVREIGDFSWTHAATIRQIISRKHGEAAFQRWWQEFAKGALTVHERTDFPAMDEDLAKRIWGLMVTSGAYAFNAAHCVAYGFIAYWCQWFKVYHPDVFFAMSLKHGPEVRGAADSQGTSKSITGGTNRSNDLIRDAAKHGIRVLPPSPDKSDARWAPVRGQNNLKLKRPAIRAGFEQVPGIGAKQAAAFIKYRGENGGLETWEELTTLRGVGDKTIEKIVNFVAQEDHFGAFTLAKNIDLVKGMLQSEALGDGLPYPTHTAKELIQQDKSGIKVCWIGTILQRNIRDMFEINRARTGEALDPATVKDAHLNESAMLVGEDGSDTILLKIDRWKYPTYKPSIFGMQMGHDLVLVDGVAPKFGAQQINIKRLWVIDPTED